MSDWKPAKKKLTKSQKRRAAYLREQTEWLEEVLKTRPQLIADKVDLVQEGTKLTVVRTQNGRKNKLEDDLSAMKQELNEIYSTQDEKNT